MKTEQTLSAKEDCDVIKSCRTTTLKTCSEILVTKLFSRPQMKLYLLKFLPVLPIQPLNVTLRVGLVAGTSSPWAMALTGSGVPLRRCLPTTLTTHHLWTTLQTQLKV